MKKLEKNLSLDKTLTVLCKLFFDLVFSNKLWNYTENKWIYVFF